MPGIGEERQTESGIILVDRRRHWPALEYALWLNLNDNITYGLACECPGLSTAAACCCQRSCRAARGGQTPPHRFAVLACCADGDKDTFRAAFFLAGCLDSFNQIKHPLGLMLEQREVREER